MLTIRGIASEIFPLPFSQLCGAEIVHLEFYGLMYLNSTLVQLTQATKKEIRSSDCEVSFNDSTSSSKVYFEILKASILNQF